jgi:hypothetical protein
MQPKLAGSRQSVYGALDMVGNEGMDSGLVRRKLLF